MKTVDLKMMTDSQEKISDLLQPLLEIAEQNRDIEEWNTHAESLLEVVQSLLDKQKQDISLEIASYSSLSVEQTEDLLKIVKEK